MRSLLFFLLIHIACHLPAANISDYLLPAPKQLTVKQGQFTGQSVSITINNFIPQYNKPLLQLLNAFSQTAIQAQISPIRLNTPTPSLTTRTNKTLNPQGYSITIENRIIEVTGGSNIGIYYGLLTLQQIGQFAIENGYWPCLELSDEPDFERRGIMLDISRDKVPTMKTLYAMVDQLAAWKTNEIQLYTEHTFAYKNHKTVWEKSSPMTAEEIQKLDQYCQDHFIDLVPNQNSFGHMRRWLKHKEYVHLAELPTPGKTIWGRSSRTSLSPVEPGSLELMKELYAELLPNFSSPYFNIGCDETVELGVGKSKALCNKIGKGRVYLEFVLQLNKEVQKYNKTTQIWGDIILHHPELIAELPKDMVALIWGYEANYPFNKHCPQFQQAGLPYYVCPGTSTWNSLIGRNKNGFANLKNAAINGKKYGATGYLNTNWGDQGHWQPLTVSYPGIMYGAALSWNVENNQNIDIAQHISLQLYNDKTGKAGEAIVNIGNAYLKMRAMTDNSSIFHQLLKRNKRSIKTDRWLRTVSSLRTEQTIAYIQTELEKFNQTQLNCWDADIVHLEFNQACNLTLHSCELALAKLSTDDGYFTNIPPSQKEALRISLNELVANHRRIWLMRNRIGGLDDSARKMTNVLATYK